MHAYAGGGQLSSSLWRRRGKGREVGEREGGRGEGGEEREEEGEQGSGEGGE